MAYIGGKSMYTMAMQIQIRHDRKYKDYVYAMEDVNTRVLEKMKNI